MTMGKPYTKEGPSAEDKAPCRISHTSVKTLSAIPHALYAKKQPAVRKSGKYNKQSHPTNVPISCTMRAYWLAY